MVLLFSLSTLVIDIRDVRPAIQDLTHPEVSLPWLS